MPDTTPEAPNVVTHQLIEQLRRHPKRVVFTEGEDLRVIEAAARLVEQEAVIPILLGRRTRIRAMAGQNQISLKFIKIINPVKSSDLPLFVKRAQNMARYRASGQIDTEETIIRPHYFGSMMVQYGHADAIVGGNQAIPASYFRALLHNIKPLKDVPRIFGVSLLTAPHFPLLGENGMLFLADTGLIPQPDVTQLSSIAIETGKLAHHFLGRRPIVDLLSHSTKGTSTTQDAQKVAAATALAKARITAEHLDIELDGELQADVAIDPEAAETKLPDAARRKAADVLVFPNLDAGHISLKLLQHLAGAQVYGKLILGLARPAAQIPRTSSVESIFGTAAAVAVEAIKYHELHPESDF
ncbi:MAG: phosphate acyltransferase [Akkermansiaceae bacterium]|jgi:phosphate acetyltransferase|nr:phosphate acyltransferase [Akkermansiaceae bacterium]MDP4646304.1 phosphate acyltransferase [Akkermansiaceae bacterium]MDP4721462.1 phosphate acyltransferase [Akkermansiaceae bacterium]MDP4779855.1 phosphate acyltransferase [Akkermansiaceae bacterium]MDP4845822.1 phosphate acyltransferase [Akkermansiaceae bacterium]